MKKISQSDQVKETMKQNEGFATLGFLYSNVDVSNWETKTPFASIRRILQVNDSFFKIKPGLWGLTEKKNEIVAKLGIAEKKSEKAEIFNHSYYQGLVVEIGNLKGFSTFVPNQDKNKRYLNQSLKEIASVGNIYEFTYPEIVNRARTVDIIWFNSRRMPSSFFEIEHSTDIYNSLIKFAELQDFNSKFNIVSATVKKREFESKLKAKVFEEIKDRIKFISYEHLSELHTNLYKYYALQKEISI